MSSIEPQEVSNETNSIEKENDNLGVSRYPNVKSLSENLRNLCIMNDELALNLRQVIARKATTIQKPCNKRERLRNFQKVRTSFAKLKACASPACAIGADVTAVPQMERLTRKRSYLDATSLSKDLSQLYTKNKNQSNTDIDTNKPFKKRKHLRESSSSSSVLDTYPSSPERSIKVTVKERNCQSAKRRKVSKGCKVLNNTFSDFTIFGGNEKTSSSRRLVGKKQPSVDGIVKSDQLKKESIEDESCLAKELSLLSVSEMTKENIAPVSIQPCTPSGGKKYKEVISRYIQSPKLAMKDISRDLMVESDQLGDQPWKRNPLAELTPTQHFLRIQQQMKAGDSLSHSSKKD